MSVPKGRALKQPFEACPRTNRLMPAVFLHCGVNDRPRSLCFSREDVLYSLCLLLFYPRPSSGEFVGEKNKIYVSPVFSSSLSQTIYCCRQYSVETKSESFQNRSRRMCVRDTQLFSHDDYDSSSPLRPIKQSAPQLQTNGT